MKKAFPPLNSNLSDHEITRINPIIFFQPRSSVLYHYYFKQYFVMHINCETSSQRYKNHKLTAHQAPPFRFLPAPLPTENVTVYGRRILLLHLHCILIMTLSLCTYPNSPIMYVLSTQGCTAQRYEWALLGLATTQP